VVAIVGRKAVVMRICVNRTTRRLSRNHLGRVLIIIIIIIITVPATTIRAYRDLVRARCRGLFLHLQKPQSAIATSTSPRLGGVHDGGKLSPSLRLPNRNFPPAHKTEDRG